MTADAFDAIVIGAGPNGLVAGNLLLDAGWSVLLLEEQDEPGGAVKSAELIEPGYVNDRFSAFYPLAASSPAIKSLGLEKFGLKWCRSDIAVAHPRADGSASFVASDLDRTAANLDSFAAGDGDRWRELFEQWLRLGPELLGTLFTMFPPVKPIARLARAASTTELLDLARVGVSGARAQTDEWFNGEGARRLLAGNALHADLSPDEPPSAVFGWVLMCLAQTVGFPVPRGGAGSLSGAMARRFTENGGELVTGAHVTHIVTSGGRAKAVEFNAGSATARKAVLADVGAPQLYLDLLDDSVVTPRVAKGLKRFSYDDATVKIDWTLDAPIPWTATDVRRSGTVHVAEGIDALTKQSAELALGQIPSTPYLVLGQYSALDPTRAPEGKDTAWAYTHVPQDVRGDAGGELKGDWNEEDEKIFVDRVEAEVEKLAPGFRDQIRGRHVMTPPKFLGQNRNLVNGAVNGGTSSVRQQLVFRPIPGLARPETPVKGLFLASASAHPGGGVHGACGANAARAAIATDKRDLRTVAFGALARRIQR